MIIQEEDFKLEEDDGCWNLYLLKHIGGTNPRDEIQLVGYGYSLLAALRRIALHRASMKKPIGNLKEIAQLYVEEIRKLQNSVKALDGLRSVIL